MGLAFNWEPGQRGPIQRPVQCPDEQGFFPPLETFVASVSFFSLQFLQFLQFLLLVYAYLLDLFWSDLLTLGKALRDARHDRTTDKCFISGNMSCIKCVGREG